MKNTRGRPPKTQADQLIARTVFHWVSLETGCEAEAIELLIEPGAIRTDAKVERPRKWDRYKTGAMCPTDDGTSRSTIGRAEKVAPGVRAFFHHPLWRALQPGSLSADSVFQEMRKLTSLKDILFAAPSISPFTGIEISPADNPLRRSFDNEVFEALIACSDMDALAAFFLSVHEADDLGSLPFRDAGMAGYRAIVPSLRQSILLGPFIDDICDLADEKFGDVVFVAPNRKMNIRFFTRNMKAAELGAADTDELDN